MERELRKLRASLPRAEEKPRRTLMGRRANRDGDSKSDDAREPVHYLDRVTQYLEVAKGEINRLDYIVTQFLQAIRPTPPNLELSSLNEVGDKTIELLLPELDNRGITVKCEFARGLPATPVDPAQIQQTLVNLIKNAMHAMTRGGVLTLQTGSTPEFVWVAVADTGGGISREKIKHIFEPYFTTKKKGTGLGLMIVQRIVRAHGGRIEVESNLGHGTCFRIWLPRHERQPRLLEARHDG
jgi:signal transduction histidine kinase